MKISNQFQWFLGALLMTALLLTNTFTAFALTGPGVIDNIDGGTIRGWAWDSSNPASSVEVSVVITNQSTGEATGELKAIASEYRTDLAAFGIGNGNYGFTISVPWDTYENGSYLVEAYANGQKLSGSKTYRVGQGAVNMTSLGVFRTTAYCPCRKCSSGWGGRTSTGAIASAGHTIAVDPRVIPYGTQIMINGIVYTAEDRGGAVKGNHIDIYFNTHAETRAYGSRNVEVFLIH